jgi:hypothetical protein
LNKTKKLVDETTNKQEISLIKVKERMKELIHLLEK